MRLLCKAASLTFFTLALALGTMGIVTTAQAQVAATCPQATNTEGNLVCPYQACGFLGLKSCQHVIVYDANGTFVNEYCDCR